MIGWIIEEELRDERLKKSINLTIPSENSTNSSSKQHILLLKMLELLIDELLVFVLDVSRIRF